MSNGFSTTEVVVGGLVIAGVSVTSSYFLFRPSKEERESLEKVLAFGKANNILNNKGDVDLAKTISRIEQLAKEAGMVLPAAEGKKSEEKKSEDKKHDNKKSA